MTRDDLIQAIAPFIRPLKNRVQDLVLRGFVTMVNDGLKTQKLQVGIYAGETQDDVERFQNYGHTSVPLKDSEAIIFSVGGDRSHAVCICVNDPERRLKDMQPGESALYDDQGQFVKIARDGINTKTDKNVNTDCKAATTTAESINAKSSDITLGLSGSDNVVTATRLVTAITAAQTAVEEGSLPDSGTVFKTNLITQVQTLAGSSLLKAD